MALSAIERGNLEKDIESEIRDIPSTADMIRGDRELMLKSDRDFVLGMAWGGILAGFTIGFIQRNRRRLRDDELTEFSAILRKRTRDIDAIIRGAHP